MSTDNFVVAEAQLLIEEARKDKAERIKALGEPIQLPGKPLAIEIRNNVAWIADNTNVIRKTNLESGKILQIYKGHTGPVTSIAFCDRRPGSGDQEIIVSGSWDNSIKLWDTKTKEVISTTPKAHGDFVKSLHVFPTLRLLISGSADKIVRFWDLSTLECSDPLKSLGFISSHTRPVECLDGETLSETSAILYTGDTMGVIKVWDLQLADARWKATLIKTINNHRTRINELRYGHGHLWTASSDETAQILPQVPVDPTDKSIKSPKPLEHPMAVRAILPLTLTTLGEPYLLTAAGDVLRTFEVSELDDPQLLSLLDAHAHDITAIRLWIRQTVDENGQKLIEPWIVTTSLDKTLRKWKLTELLQPPKPETNAPKVEETKPEIKASALTEEEERELAEFMDDNE
ncbi:WD40 repeat-like protein [Pholiota conissans]|uniref:WD40 repeat-like protein n=1 Tax=Pholiota conissans TaxID=109636 RepID=A0A9P5YSB3_9AGAR|nr:WD40 repeat-like protein [Pholiota conissans]